jgi:hypothetical protein
MAAPRVLVRDEDRGAKKRWIPPAPDFGWELLGFMGFVFLFMGLLDIAIAGYPVQFGNPEWEFGTIGSWMNALTVPALGLALLLGSAVARGWQQGIKLWAIVLIILAIVVLGLLIVYSLNLPLAFRAVQEPLARSGLKRSVAKSLIQGVFYPAVFLILALKALRRSKARTG